MKFFISVVCCALLPVVAEASTTDMVIEQSVAPSIFFIPGIQSTRLAKETSFGTEDQLWEPTRNQDVEQLEMSSGGESINSVYTTEVIDSAFGVVDVYSGWIEYLGAMKNDGTISDYAVMPYDWRYGPDEAATRPVQQKDGAIDPIQAVIEMADRTGSKVTIVAHSYGGLVTKYFVDQLVYGYGRSDVVDRVIFIAVPHYGTPKSIGALLHGYEQERFHGLLIDDETARDVMKNFPSVYSLLPSNKYFETNSSDVVTFDMSTSTEAFRMNYGDAISGTSELKSFVSDSQREAPKDTYEVGSGNGTMVQNELFSHDRIMDSMIFPSNVSVSEIVGVGLNTVRGFHYQEFTRKECFLGFISCEEVTYYEAVPRMTQYGDGTVVSNSAEGYAGIKDSYYINLDSLRKDVNETPREHFNITENSSIQTLVKNIITGTTSLPVFISKSQPSFGESRDIISVHSPVSVVVTDDAGRRIEKTGIGEHAIVRADIPGSSYHEFGSSTYAVIPSGVDYRVTLSGEAEGSYSLLIETQRGEAVPQIVSLLSSTTVIPQSVMTFEKTGGVWSDLRIDSNGDGVIDTTISLTGEVSTTELFSSLREKCEGLTLLKDSERSWLISATDRAEQLGGKKGYDATPIVRTFDQINRRLLSYITQGTVTTDEYAAISAIIEKITTR